MTNRKTPDGDGTRQRTQPNLPVRQGQEGRTSTHPGHVNPGSEWLSGPGRQHR